VTAPMLEHRRALSDLVRFLVYREQVVTPMCP